MVMIGLTIGLICVNYLYMISPMVEVIMRPLWFRIESTDTVRKIKKCWEKKAKKEGMRDGECS